MTTDYKVTELFCVIDKFYKHLTNRYFIEWGKLFKELILFTARAA